MSAPASQAEGGAPAVGDHVLTPADGRTPPALRIRQSEIHGRGLFAEEAIAKGQWIGTYEGRVTKRDGKYVLWIYDEEADGPYGIAGKSHMRFVNHSKRPNAEFDGFECIARRKIRPGEEITFDYGEDWE